MQRFATHIPVLLACLRKTSGPILELGGGWYSTPIIHAFATDRDALTVEANQKWYNLLAKICTDEYQAIHTNRYKIIHVTDYDQAPIDDQHWSVVLLDHEPPPRRAVDLVRLSNNSDLIIAHDSEQFEYGYWPVFPQFKYCYTYTRIVPWTTVVSNTTPLDWLKEALRPLW